MSIGKTIVKITSEKLNIGDIYNSVLSPSCGGVSLFVGTTRNNFEDKEVISLEYECYEKMAVKEIEKICAHMREQWGSIEQIAVIHRIGVVPTEEASIVIAVAAPHRQDAINAAEYAINTLKKTVPIWKKEKYRDGSKNWKANKECGWTEASTN